MRLLLRSFAAPFLLLLVFGVARAAKPPEPWRLAQSVDVAPVWSGHRVGFALLTHGKQQFVAYYDADRRMTVASRLLDSTEWTAKVLPTSVKWDSHNYVTMAFDAQGQLHVSGNMHCAPLIYFRTTRPGDVTTLEQVLSMTGENENRCTYPRFVTGSEGELIFTYRDGSSGNGSQIWNIYDPDTQAWRRLLDSPLFSGEGKMNAYFVGPVQDTEGVFHICWVWRDTPDCATNHDLSYARSRDLVHWETSEGKELTLPITLGTAEIVDPVPPGGGIINGNTKIGFDAEGRVILSYHKHDSDGHTQIYNARREADGWKIRQASDWDYRWEFGGGGTIIFEIRVGAVSVTDDGLLVQSRSHAKRRGGRWQLDAETLKPIAPAPLEPRYPKSLGQVKGRIHGLDIRRAHDLGNLGDARTRYVMQWETRAANRDRPYPGPPPPPSMLRVHKMVRE
jgi:putative BNR repeat neuraminidase